MTELNSVERKCSLSVKLTDVPKQLGGTRLVIYAVDLKFLVHELEEHGVPDDAEVTFFSEDSALTSWHSRHD